MDVLKKAFDSCARGGELANVQAASAALMAIVRSHPQRSTLAKRLTTAGLQPHAFLRWEDFLRLSTWLFDGGAEGVTSAAAPLGAVYSEMSAGGGLTGSPVRTHLRQRQPLPHSVPTPSNPPTPPLLQAPAQTNRGHSRGCGIPAHTRTAPRANAEQEERVSSCFRSAHELRQDAERAKRVQYVKTEVYGRQFCRQRREIESPSRSRPFDGVADAASRAQSEVEAGRRVAMEQIGALLRNDSEVLKRRLREERLLEVQATATRRLALKRERSANAISAHGPRSGPVTQGEQKPELMMGGLGGSYSTSHARRCSKLLVK